MNEHPAGGRGATGLTLVEVLVAAAIVALGTLAVYSSIVLADAAIRANQQRLEAEGLAMDAMLTVLHTWDFPAISLATTLTFRAPAAASLLPTNTEIRVLVAPEIGVTPPCRWDLEARVKRDRIGLGGRLVSLTNDVVFRAARYAIGRLP